MAKKTYVGVNNAARNVSKMYVGVNGVARKVKKAYVGVNGVARQCYSALPKIVTWNGGTDEEIVAMVQAADEGLINLADYWSVGDERTVPLSAMAATGVGESHVAQDVTLVLMNIGGKTLRYATASGRRTCSFAVGMKGCLREGGYMKSTNDTYGGWTSCARRTWCNSVFKASLPPTLLPIFKQFENKTSAGNMSTTINTDIDWFAYAAEVEVFGSTPGSVNGEGTLFAWYSTAANRIKNGLYWWERSPHKATSAGYCLVNSDGSAGANVSSASSAISTFGVI